MAAETPAERIHRLIAERAAGKRPDLEGQEVRVGICAETESVRLWIDNRSVDLDADMADQLSADLRLFALELRNGGRLE